MNDVITPLLENPGIYGFYFVTRIIWAIFGLLVFIRYVQLARRVWRDFRWWAQANDGMGVETKRIVAEGRFAMKVWLAIGGSLLFITGLIAISQIVWGEIPRPDVAAQNAFTVLILLGFIFTYYKAASASASIDTKLRDQERRLELERVRDIEGKDPQGEE